MLCCDDSVLTYIRTPVKYNGSALQKLSARTWIVHWGLYIFFNHEKGSEVMIDTVLGDGVYVNAVQTTSPHLIRYLTVATCLAKNRRRNHIKDLVKIIQQVSAV